MSLCVCHPSRYTKSVAGKVHGVCPQVGTTTSIKPKPNRLGSREVINIRAIRIDFIATINGSSFIMIFVEFVLLVIFPFSHHRGSILSTVCTLK